MGGGDHELFSETIFRRTKYGEWGHGLFAKMIFCIFFKKSMGGTIVLSWKKILDKKKQIDFERFSGGRLSKHF